MTVALPASWWMPNQPQSSVPALNPSRSSCVRCWCGSVQQAILIGYGAKRSLKVASAAGASTVVERAGGLLAAVNHRPEQFPDRATSWFAETHNDRNQPCQSLGFFAFALPTRSLGCLGWARRKESSQLQPLGPSGGKANPGPCVGHRADESSGHLGHVLESRSLARGSSQPPPWR